jgi:hypothetical protein
MKIVSFSLEQGNKYFAEIDDDRFFVGNRVSFDGGKGLMNVSGTLAQRYDRTAFRDQHGFWADFIHPTAVVEGSLFHAMNTYDRARFTFSFLQYAAHVPDGDFVLYLRALLELPLAKEYFPDLRVQNGRIVRLSENGLVLLETGQSTDGLLDYLNPSRQEVEDTEVIQAAKFIHWAQNDPEHRRVQVDIGIAHFKNKMIEYAERYELDGPSDAICLVVADIRHQGRARTPVIVSALQSSDPLNALLKIGEPEHHARLLALRQEIGKLVEEGILGTRNYSLATKDFVVS